MLLISVVMPVHNAAIYLPRAFEQLRALVEVTSHDVEIIAIDDHSTDDSGELLRGWADSLPNVRIISAVGSGVAEARNQAVAECRGDYVWFVDADDTWSPQIVQRLVDVAHTRQADLVVCNATKSFPDGSTQVIRDAQATELIDCREMFIRVLNGSIQGHLWNKLFARAVLGESPFPTTRAHSDLGGVLRLTPRFDRVVLVPEALYTYEIRSGSILNSPTYRAEDLEECLAIAQETSRLLFLNSPREITTFKYRNVVIPTMNQQLRRSEKRRGRGDRMYISRASMMEVAGLVRSGQMGLAIKVGLLLASPQMYGLIFRAYSRRRPSNVAILTGADLLSDPQEGRDEESPNRLG